MRKNKTLTLSIETYDKIWQLKLKLTNILIKQYSYYSNDAIRKIKIDDVVTAALTIATDDAIIHYLLSGESTLGLDR